MNAARTPCRRAVFLAACSVVLLGSCASIATRSVPGDGRVDITLGPDSKCSRLEIDGRRFELTLIQIVDSRCPPDARCIWAGELSAKLTVERIDVSAPRHEVTLGEETSPKVKVLGLELILSSIDEKTVTFSVRSAARSTSRAP